MQTSVLQSPPGHKRRPDGGYCDELSPSKVPLYQQGGTPQQQWHANRSSHQQTPPQQHYTAQRGTEPFGNAVTPQTLRNASRRVEPTAWQPDPRKWQPPTPEPRAGIAAQQQEAPGVAAARMAAAVNNSQPFNYYSQVQQQQQPQQQPPAAACTPEHQSYSQSWHSPQQTACADQRQWQQQQQQQLQQLPQKSLESPGLQETRQQEVQQQQQGLWQHRKFCSPQQQQGPRSPLQAAQQQQQRTEFAAPSCSPVAAGLNGSSSSSNIGHGSSTGSSTSLFAAAAAGIQRGSNSPGWTSAAPAAAAAPPPFLSSVAAAAAATSTMATTPIASAASGAPAAAAAAAATPSSSSSSIWRLIRHSFRLQKAVADRDVDMLCSELGLDEWHVRHEVSRLNKYFAVTFPLRLVLEQFGVLGFVSSRTLMQISHLPPQHITLLDAWLTQDLAAAAAAGGGGSSSSGAADVLIGGSLVTKHSSYWLSNKGGAAAFGDLPPSWAILQLVIAGRLTWVPSAAAAAEESFNATSAAAAAGPFTAAKHGSYIWQHGPVDAWLCNDISSSSSNCTVAAARTARAEQLNNNRFPRNQAKLLLDPGFAAAAAAAAATPGSVDLLGFGCLEFGFGIEDLSHSSSCHLQRHPVLGDHDRLIRVSLNRSAAAIAAAAAAAAGSSGGSEETSRALEGLLTHGVMLAGRRYRRLVQKDIGQAGESLWLLATDSVCPEDTAGPEAWPPINPAAARQLLGGFSSLPNVSKQSARGALLVSNTLPVKVPAYKVFYIPDVQGPADTQGNLSPATSGSSSSSSSELMFSDGSGFISADLAELVPAISAGEIISGDRGGGVMWPGTPMQVRVFDPHFGGVIAKGTLTPLQQSVLPHGTIVLRSSQVKAPAAKHFGEKWIKHWNNMLVWAYQQHEVAWQQQQQQQRRQMGQVAGQAAISDDVQQQPYQQQQLQQQQSQQQQWFRPGTMDQRWVPAAAAAAAGRGQTWSIAAGAADHHHEQQQQQQQQQCCSASCDSNLLATATAAAAGAKAQRPLLSLLHPQDRPWFEQLWYVHDALQLYETAVSSSSSSGGGVGSAIPVAAAAIAPPKACQCVAYPQQQQQQEDARSASCSTISTSDLFSAASSSSTASTPAAAAAGCACGCVLEVVSRAPAGCERAYELRINKNLLLLLHNAGVPQHVFEQWSDIEQHKLVGIDSSYEAAYTAAKSAGDLEVIQKLEALIGVQLQHPGSSSSSTYASSAVRGVTNLSTGFSNLGISHAPNTMASQHHPAAAAAEGSDLCPRFMLFKPDLALKQDLHAIKVRRRAKMANMSLPVPSAEDTAAAVRTGIIPAEGNSFCSPSATGGVRLLGLPDPSCGSVPEGCVAVSPGLVPPSQQAVIYRDPGIHPGDVRRVRVIPYPQQLQQLLPPNFSGALFLPSVGSSCLGASLAGGDYDGDHYLLLWDERVITWFRAQDPEPWQGLAPCAGVGRDRWGLEEGSGWECVEQKLTEYYSFCCQVAGLIGEAHTLWEAYADRCGVDSMYCKVLAEGYYQALDAAKTGVEPTIQDYYRHNSALGVDINHLPPWHSRVVKEYARTGRQSGMGACAREGMTRSKIIRALWCRIHDLEPVDYLDTALLDLDPDLTLQEGPAAVCKETMEQLIDKWDRLCGEWNCSWAQIMRKTGAACSRAEQRSLIDEKAELQLMLKAKFQSELWGGLEAVAAAAAGSGSSILDRVLMEASACYQAVYRRAKAKQDKLQQLTADQRTRQAIELGYEDQPRVAMAWRVAGQWLRMLKATKPLRLQQAQMLQELQRMQGRCPAVWASGGSVVQTNGFAGGLGAYRGCLGLVGGARVELGSVQHPYLAGIVAQQQSKRGQMRSNWGLGDVTGLDL